MTTTATLAVLGTIGIMPPPGGSRDTRQREEDGRRPREDALPEHLQYRDDGCDLFAACLNCPLPRCRYDVPGGARAMLNRYRDDEIRRMREDTELGVDEIAERFRVSRRTVFRVLQQGSQQQALRRGAA